MSLPALDDIADPIDGVVRIETSPREKATPIIMEMMRSVYPHDQVFGEYCTVNDYIDCPPDELFAYLSDTRSLEEWTYSLRGFSRLKSLACGSPMTGSARNRNLHPHRRQRRGAHGRLSLCVGSGQTPLDDLSDASRRRTAGLRQTGLRGVVDQLPSPVLRQQPLSGDRSTATPGVGRRLLGHVRCRPSVGAEEPQVNCGVPPPQRSADDAGLDEMSASMSVSLIDVSTYLPGDPIGADYYAQFAESDDLRDNMMFRAPEFRHHVAEDETAIDMVERATEGLIKRHGDDAIAERRRVDHPHTDA